MRSVQVRAAKRRLHFRKSVRRVPPTPRTRKRWRGRTWVRPPDGRRTQRTKGFLRVAFIGADLRCVQGTAATGVGAGERHVNSGNGRPQERKEAPDTSRRRRAAFLHVELRRRRDPHHGDDGKRGLSRLFQQGVGTWGRGHTCGTSGLEKRPFAKRL